MRIGCLVRFVGDQRGWDSEFECACRICPRGSSFVFAEKYFVPQASLHRGPCLHISSETRSFRGTQPFNRPNVGNSTVQQVGARRRTWLCLRGRPVLRKAKLGPGFSLHLFRCWVRCFQHRGYLFPSPRLPQGSDRKRQDSRQPSEELAVLQRYISLSSHQAGGWQSGISRLAFAFTAGCAVAPTFQRVNEKDEKDVAR